MNPFELWTVSFRNNPQAIFRLFCFPSAGGGAASYRTWSNQLPSLVEVRAIRLPGRETRLGEAPYSNLPQLVETLAKVIEPHLDMPFAFFGHSMGSMVSFEVARYLRRQGLPIPAHLFVSAWPAPQLRKVRSPITDLPDSAFISAIQQRYGGIPTVILQEPDLLKLFLPSIRADMTMLEQYAYADEPPLPCSISAYGGTKDVTASESELAAWQEQTSAQFASQMFVGEHFYLQAQQETLLRVVSADLNRSLNQIASPK
jgi:medium-chain acyl-[acyl-carrier-protein] hydrolase